jgi:hypothetical protein
MDDVLTAEERFVRIGVDTLSLRAIDILRKMSKGKELAAEGRMAFVGYEPTSRKLLNSLLLCCAVRLEGGTQSIGELERYTINEIGKRILEQRDAA